MKIRLTVRKNKRFLKKEKISKKTNLRPRWKGDPDPSVKERGSLGTGANGNTLT